MPGMIPFFIEGKVASIIQSEKTAYVKVPNGNVYYLHPFTPGIDFEKLKVGTKVSCEVTEKLARVFSAKIIEDDK
jgi:hypothetical protein